MIPNKYQMPGSLRNIYRGMKQRCTNPKNKNYPLYKDKLCLEWYVPKVFFDWAENNGWKHGLTIDRIDSNLGYCPSNCRFITAKENTIKGNKERRLTRAVYNGKIYTVKELSQVLGMTYSSVSYRYKRGYYV